MIKKGFSFDYNENSEIMFDQNDKSSILHIDSLEIELGVNWAGHYGRLLYYFL